MVKDTPANVKKKHKNTSNEENSAVVDVYKKSVEFEEKEALTRSPGEDAKIYFDTCKSIRQILFDVFNLKNEKTPEAQEEIQEKCTEACLLITVLKKLNRYDKFRSLVSRETLAAEKQKSDSIHLQFQNLLYEQAYMEAQISKCKQYKSRDENIELVSVEEFLKEAPESLTGKFKIVKKENQDDSFRHEQYLARLQWELMQREKLQELRSTLENEKKQFEGDITLLKKRLDSLGPCLMAILEASKPLQEQFGLPIDKIRAEHKLASLLPDALYLLYVNVTGFKNVYKNLRIDLQILGDQDEAVLWKEKGDFALSDHESEQENDVQEEVVEVSKKRRHRKSTHQPDVREEKKSKILESHPLSVEISLTLEGNDAKLNLKFTYYHFLKVITVVPTVSIPNNLTGTTARDILLGENVTGALMDDDFGTESPNPENHDQLQKKGLGPFRNLGIGFAYVWAQKICGLDFLNRKDSNQLSLNNVGSVMKALHARFKSRVALALQLQQLDQNLIAAIPEAIAYPKNAVSTLTNWSSSTWMKFCQTASTKALVEHEIALPGDVFYLATISRPPAVLQAHIAIKNDYPKQAPLFSLTLNYNGTHHSDNSDELRDMERAVNTLNVSRAGWLLSVQLRHLCAFMDVYLESWAPSGTFPQCAVFFRNISARNRRRPFRFKKIGAGVFTQQ